jgi:multidrug efflux system membrane fusion protein
VPVAVATAEKRDVPIQLDGLGTVTAYYTVNVKTQVDGRVERVRFTEGQSVKKGDVLVEIDPRPFANQLRTALAARSKNEASLAFARRTLERNRALAAGGLASTQEVEDQESLVRQLEAQLGSDDAAIANARLQLEYARIVSPIDGVVGVRLVDPGNIVHPSDANGLVVVTMLDPIAVVFTLPEDDLPRVRRAMDEGVASVEAFNRDGTEQLGAGRLEVVDNQINQATATIRCKAVVPNPRRLLWPNQFVKARLHVATHQGAVVAPASIVQRGPPGTFAFVVGPDDTAVVRPIAVELTTGDPAVLARGLAPGERVVTDGQNQLRAGAKIAPRPAPPPSPDAARSARGAMGPAPHGAAP